MVNKREQERKGTKKNSRATKSAKAETISPSLATLPSKALTRRKPSAVKSTSTTPSSQSSISLPVTLPSGPPIPEQVIRPRRKTRKEALQVVDDTTVGSDTPFASNDEPDFTEFNALDAWLGLEDDDNEQMMDDHEMQTRHSHPQIQLAQNLPTAMVVDTDHEYDNNHVVREARNTAKLYSSGSDSDEETESEEVIQVPITYSREGAMDNFTIASDITWLNFQFTLSEKLLVRPTDLNLAYRFSSDPRNQPPNRLSDAVSFIEMIAAARDGLAGYAAAKAKAKKGTTKPAKPFKVEIVNLDTGNAAKATSRGGTKKAATGHRAKRKANVNSDGSGTDGSDKESGSGVKGSSQWVQRIDRDNSCDKHHGQSCIVLANGDHYKLTHADKSLWGMLMTQGHDSTKKPPHQLRIPGFRLDTTSTDAPGRSTTTSLKPDQPVAPSHNISQPPAPSLDKSPARATQHQFAGLGSTGPAHMAQYPFMMPQPYYNPYYGHGGMPFPSAIGSPGTVRRYGYMQSPTMHDLSHSNPMDLDDPSIYPRLTSWLQELDDGPRGADAHNFTQYAAVLDQNGYKRIFQLEKLTKEDFIAIYPEIRPGTASLILEYACKDCEKIRRNEAKRLHKVRHQPLRYQ